MEREQITIPDYKQLAENLAGVISHLQHLFADHPCLECEEMMERILAEYNAAIQSEAV